MRREPIPRYEAYDLYWYFAAERQRVFNSRVAGDVRPWSQDAILEEYKFCNVFRASDRVSQYLIRDVAYGPQVGTDADALFRIVAFRTFSRTSTWDAVCAFLGRPPIIDDLTDISLRSALEDAHAKHGGLYTGAFILCANNAYGQRLKYLNHLELFRHMFVAESLGERLVDTRSLQDIYNLLHEFPLMGDFMSYQTAIDLNYSALIDFDEDDFTQPGPGALRGIAKCFESVGDFTPAEVIQWMVDRQEFEFDRLGLEFTGLWGRRLHAIDCQGLFCETDKYCRIALPHLASARKRMKAKFKPSSESFELFFPPKWGIDRRVPSGRVLGSTGEYGGQLQLV